ncbi:MAG: superoxide dismutase [Pirellulales bacterium]|nr:superoxide dismutase [Pirellulales bacterium]
MYALTKLPYAFDALEPHIDARTMEIHHTKHHQSYVDKLNAALEKYPKLHTLPIAELLADLDQVPEDVRTAVRNNGGGVVNHDLFFATMSPDGGGRPVGKLAGAIDETFGGFEQLQKKFAAAAVGVFGSGWAWLSAEKNGKLLIETTPGHDTPLMFGRKPVLVVDVWEHAYYLKHQNRRPDSIADWWNVVDWDKAERNYTG